MCRRGSASLDPEDGNHGRQFAGLRLQSQAGFRRLLRHGGILLRHLVQLTDANIDLSDRGGLRPRALSDALAPLAKTPTLVVLSAGGVVMMLDRIIVLFLPYETYRV